MCWTKNGQKRDRSKHTWLFNKGETFVKKRRREGLVYLASSAEGTDFFNGKTILNVGAGGTDLAADLTKMGGKGAEVTSVDMNYAEDGDDPSRIRADSSNLGLALGGKKYDVVFNSYQWSILSGEDTKKTLVEMAKCLKDGGVAYIYPGIDRENEGEFLKIAKEWLRDR